MSASAEDSLSTEEPGAQLAGVTVRNGATVRVGASAALDAR
jgi:hypothetical protein